jgi:predicted glycoside hydrolase/deacetylase ChbG (UPF0249 family)
MLQAVDEGILRNISVMVPGPAFEDAAEVFAGRDDICFGLHVTLNSEWDFPKWGPVSPLNTVPSLIEPDGFFTMQPSILFDRGFSKEEALAEVAAQLQRAREFGFHISYLDEHMGVGWIGLRTELAALAMREGLVDAQRIPWLPSKGPLDGTLVEQFDEQLRHVPLGAYVVCTHPMFDDEEARKFRGPNKLHGVIARNRDRERRELIDPRLRAFVEKHGIRIARYDEVSLPADISGGRTY